MSTELAKSSVTIPAYLKQGNAELEEQRELITSVNSLFPRCRMSKEGGFVLDLEEQVMSKPMDMYITILGVRNIFADRALWEPIDDGDLICSTGLTGSTPSSLKEAEGKWRLELDDPRADSPSGEKVVQCSRCKWARFGSEREWRDDREDSNGAACKARRIVFALPMEHAPIPGMTNLFKRSTDTPIRLVLPSTSIKAVSRFAAKASVSGLKLEFAVFKITTKIMGEGMIKWAVLEADLVGFINEDTHDFITGTGDHDTNLIENVHSLVTAQSDAFEEELYENTQTEEF